MCSRPLLRLVIARMHNDSPAPLRRAAPGSIRPHAWARLLLAFAAWHVFAITVGALPPACAPGPDGSDEADPETAQVLIGSTGTAAAALRTCRAVVAGARPVLRPVERVTGRYLRAVGLRQQWDMFSRPPRRNDFVQLRHYVQADDPLGSLQIVRESIYPASADGLRLPAGRYFEEKAIRNARQRMLRHIRERSAIRTRADLPNDLQPLLRYYASRFRARLAGDRQLVKTEIWLGAAAIAGPGAAAPAPVPADLTAGGAPDARDVASGPPVGTREQEGERRWTLYDFLREDEP